MENKLPKEKLESRDIRIDKIMPELFSGWQTLPFEECLLDDEGDFVKLKQKDTKQYGKYPVVDQGEELINGYVDDEKLIYSGELPLIIFGDHTRRIKFIDFKFAVGADGTKIFKPKEFLNIYFLYYYLLSLNIQSEGYSRHYKFLKAIDVPIPPVYEQNRIVTKLDAILARVNNCKTRLEKIPTLLKNFRQSVLNYISDAKGKELNAKEVCSLIQIGPFGTQLHQYDYIQNSIPVINPSHIKDGTIVPDNSLTISDEKFKELSNYHLRVNDVIMGRRGEMGRCAFIQTSDKLLCGTGSLFFRPDTKKVYPLFLFWQLRNQITKSYLENDAKGTTMNNLNLSIVENIPLTVPSLEEQKEIVRKVEELFAYADTIEAGYQKAKAWVDKLPQSILAKAFRGELVPQNENDEPASELLKRIQQEKQHTTKPKSKTKTTAKTKAGQGDRSKQHS